nr:conotoxin O1 M6.29 [Conus magus]
MKLTCVLIVAVLFLTACQLITADDSRDEYRAVRSSDEVQNSKSTRACSESGDGCLTRNCCPGLTCSGPQQGPVCH